MFTVYKVTSASAVHCTLFRFSVIKLNCWINLFEYTLHVSTNLTYSSSLFILAAASRRLKSFSFTRFENWSVGLGVTEETVNYRFPMSPGRGIRGDVLHRTSRSPFSWWLEHRDKERNKGSPLFQLFAFVDFAFVPSLSHLNQAAPGTTGIPETMIKVWESRDEERVRDGWWRKKKKKK